MKSKLLSLGISIFVLISALAISRKSQAQLGPDQVQTLNPKTLFAVTGSVDHPFAISISIIQNMPQIQINIVQGSRSVTYSGVPLKNLLVQAGLSADASAKSNQLTLTVIDQNGNSTTLPSESIQAIFKNGSQVLVADERDGKRLKDDIGPLMLVIPNEQPPAQQIPNLARIRVGTGS